jgi:chromosome segregation ATPase
MQDGTFNPQDFMQQLQNNGIIDQNMMGQISQLRNQMQQRLQQRAQLRQPSNLQVLLNAADEEWAVLNPKIQRIIDMTNDLRTTIDTPRSNNPTQQTPTGPAATALTALSAALNTPDTPEPQLAAKLADYRAACQRVKADLAAARADLLALLTLRQESILLNMQLID